MSYEKTWTGDWRGRVLERVRQRGFALVTDFARTHPFSSLIELADLLGGEDVAAVQIRTLLIDEARRAQRLPRTIRDLLVREIHSALPTGWHFPLDDNARTKVACALARWESALAVEQHLDCLNEEATFEAGQDLLNAELPDGWLPEGPDDPIIVGIVDRCLGQMAS